MKFFFLESRLDFESPNKSEKIYMTHTYMNTKNSNFNKKYSTKNFMVQMQWNSNVSPVFL